MRIMLETAVTLTVSDDVSCVLLANRQRGGTPNRAAVFVANVDDFTGSVPDGIVGPLRDLVLAAVKGPGVAGA